jgi:hypothetical protein
MSVLYHESTDISNQKKGIDPVNSYEFSSVILARPPLFPPCRRKLPRPPCKEVSAIFAGVFQDEIPVTLPGIDWWGVMRLENFR